MHEVQEVIPVVFIDKLLCYYPHVWSGNAESNDALWANMVEWIISIHPLSQWITVMDIPALIIAVEDKQTCQDMYLATSKITWLKSLQ